MGQLVGPLQAGARAVLDVEVDVAAGAGAAGPQLVVAGHLGGARRGDRRLDPVHLGGRERFVDQHPRGAPDDPQAGDDDRPGDDQRGDRVKGRVARHLDEAEPDQDAPRGQGVGAQVRGVALQRQRFVRFACRESTAETPRLASTREAHDGDADRRPIRPSRPTTSRWVAS